MSTTKIVIMNSNINEINTKVCSKIRMERLKRKWSQENLCEKANLNINTISSIENAKSSPTVITLAKLANAFEMTFTELTDISKVDL